MLRVRLSGRLGVEVDGTPRPWPASRRAGELLAWLALHPGTHARADLAPRFWPDVLDASARASLRTALHELRAALGEQGSAHLLATREAVGLTGEVEVDVRRAREAGDLEPGELLPGLSGEWVLEARQEHAAWLDDVLRVRAEQAAADGDAEGAVRWARRRAAADPLSEAATRDLMRALDAAGDRAAALTAFEALRERLARSLRVAPSPVTREVAEALREGGASASAAPAEPTTLERAAPPAEGTTPGAAPPAEGTTPGAAPPAEGTTPGAAAPPAAGLPRALARRPRSQLVGRAGELARLTAAFERAEGGHGGLAVIAGRPGVGKSRLAAELARAAHARGAELLLGRCHEDPVIPYQPFAEAVRSLAAERPDALTEPHGSELDALVPGLAPRPPAAAADPEGSRHRLFEAVAAVLAPRDGAARVLVIEDLHWADRGTLRLLAHVVRAGTQRRLLIAGTTRPAGPAHPLTSTLSELGREEPVERVDLDDLEPHDSARLVVGWGADAALAGRLHEATGGNPFFLEELLRHAGHAGEPGIPPTVGQAIAERVARLAPGTQDALATAAIAGRRFDLALMERLRGPEVLAALEEAVAAQFLREEDPPGMFAFLHALVRDAVLGGVSRARQARLHGAVAAALEDMPGPSAAARLRHWRAAGAAGPALAAAVEAAGEADAAFAFAEAHAHLQAALELWPQVGSGRAVGPVAAREAGARVTPATAGPAAAGAEATAVAERLAGLSEAALVARAAETAYLAGEDAASVALARRSVALAEATGDARDTALRLERLGRYLIVAGDGEEALRAHRQAVAVLPGRRESRERARALAGEAQVLMLLDRPAEGRARCEEALAAARGAGAAFEEEHALNTLGACLTAMGQRAAGIRCLEDARERAAERAGAGDARGLQELCRSTVNLSGALEEDGRVAEAAALAAEGAQLAARSGLSMYQRFLTGRAGARLLKLGRLDQADEITAPLADAPSFAASLVSARARLDLMRGHLAAAERRASKALAACAGLRYPMWLGPVAALAGEVALAAGRPADAARTAEEALAAVGDSAAVFATARLYAVGIRAAAELGATERGAGLLARLQAQLTAAGEAAPREAVALGTLARAEQSRLTTPDPAAWRLAAVRFAALGFPADEAYARRRHEEAADGAASAATLS